MSRPLLRPLPFFLYCTSRQLEYLHLEGGPHHAQLEQEDPIAEAIERRAYEIYIEGGSIDGNDVANWLAAEEELWRAPKKRKRPRQRPMPTYAPRPCARASPRASTNARKYVGIASVGQADAAQARFAPKELPIFRETKK